MKCQRCGSVIHKLGEGEKIDEAVKKSITAQLDKFIEMIINNEECDQKELGRIIGKTPEYLSTIKKGAKIPSYTIYTLLKVLALSGRKAFNISLPEFDLSKLVAMTSKTRVS